jgi:hypothetical protein
MYEVISNGKSIGIIETNKAFAEKFWNDLSRITGRVYKLREVRR